MIRPIIKDTFFLSRKAVPATAADRAVGEDLADTLRANRAGCIGLAANMIGSDKAVIAIAYGAGALVMYNPRLLSGKGPYETEEGCLSLSGTRPCRRYTDITVEYTDALWRKKTVRLSGLEAEACQHELDHLKGILI